MLTLTKQQSTFAKGIAILVMLAHHLYAFPDRFDYTFCHLYLVRLGQECGIVVGLFFFEWYRDYGIKWYLAFINLL